MRLIGLVLALCLTLSPLAAEAQPAAKVLRLGFLGPSFPKTIHASKISVPSARHFKITATSRARPSRSSGGLSTPGALAAKRATSTIPIVIIAIGDPVGSGRVSSLARPGGNVTGLSIFATDLYAKRLELLKEALPKTSRVALLFNPTNPVNIALVKETQDAARALKVQFHPSSVRLPR